MPFEAKSRYGADEVFESDADILAVVERLVGELESEAFDEPDDEHSQVAVSRGDWSLTVHVSGLMVLEDLRGITGSPDDVLAPALYRRAQSREEAVQMLSLAAAGRFEHLVAVGWTAFEGLAPPQRYLFRQTD